MQNLHRESTIEDITGKPMKALDIFSISLKHLKDLMLETMNKNIASDIISKENIDFVLTVPAIWGDGAKLFMREAAIKVKISVIHSMNLEFHFYSQKETCTNYCYRISVRPIINQKMNIKFNIYLPSKILKLKN